MTINDASADDKSINPYDIELAKKIACAAISHQMRISYQHYWKTYIQTKKNPLWPIGTIWLAFAEFIRHQAFQRDGYIFNWKEKELTFLQRELFNIAVNLPDSDIQLALNVLDERLAFYEQNNPVKPEE